ncbi:MAG: FAD-binding protein, partial [Clostridia bacterium]|nr:FAD-binding protein [Clostridia bacterium]
MYTYIVREIKLLPGSGEKELRAAAAKRLGVSEGAVIGLETVRRSVDARKKEDIRVVFSAAVTLAEKLPNAERFERETYELPTKSTLSSRPLVVGGGPAGLMAAYTLAHAGARPILIERGLPVEERAKKVGAFFAGGGLDPECNVQFGEGGAGTFSDG